MTAPAVDQLTRRNGVELARTGQWPTSTGRWDASPEDFAAAIAATECPAIRDPRLWIGHTDARFTPRGSDGEPTIGWIENLRLSDGGHTLIGDYVGVPAWLNTVMASAYPDRSVEGTYNRRCTLGHVHPFVIDGLALLGVTRPGVGVLKSLSSLDDVHALYAPAAAAGEVRIAASIPGNALNNNTAAPQHTGAMVALIPTPEDASRLAVDDGEPADELHCTLAYLGEAADLDPAARQDIIAAVSAAMDGMPVAEADGFAVAVFNPTNAGRETCIVLGLSGPDVDVVHELADQALVGLPIPDQHSPWHAHLSLIYSDDLSKVAQLVDRTGPVTFDRVRIAFGDDRIDIPLLTEPEQDPNAGGAYDNLPDGGEPVAATAGVADENSLKQYWLVGEGAARWKTWTDLYKHLRHHLDPARAKRIAASWFHLRYGYWPGDKRNRGVHASDGKGAAVPNPQPTTAEKVTQAWNATAPFSQYVVRVNASDVVVIDETDRSFLRIPVTVDGEQVTFGAARRVMPDYVDYDERQVAASVVFASRGESRPDVAAAAVSDKPWSQFKPGDYTPAQWKTACLVDTGQGDPAGKDRYKLPVREPDGTLNRNAVHAAAGGHGLDAVKGLTADDRRAAAKTLVGLYKTLGEDPPMALRKTAGVFASEPAPQPPDPGPDRTTEPDQTPPPPGGVPVSPAAEPEPTTDPKEQDDMSTLSTDVRSRLGLADDADDTAILAALDELKTKVETPAVPDPELVAASAATVQERDELRKEVKVLASQMEQVTTELAAAKAEKAATVKASVLDAAEKAGKYAPADRPQWEADYDDAPAAVTRVLASIAPGTAVPVAASGHAGDGEQAVSDIDADLANGWAAQLGLSPEVLTNG